MTLYVNNMSAMRFWCMVETSIDDVTSACSIVDVKKPTTSTQSIDSLTLDALSNSSPNIHVLVNDGRLRTRSPGLTFHIRTSPYPFGAFRRYSEDVLIASPELCFLEMANELPFFKLVEFGFLLCGTYTVNPNAISKNKREPLTTKRKIAAFITRMGTTRGCAIAQKALNLVQEGSASVRETKTAILLCAPVKLGGYGLSKPELNHRIVFTEQEQRMFGRPYVEIDLYWRKSRFGIEYDGQENHSAEKDVSRDRRKNSELGYRGIRIIRVDKEQLSNPFQVYVLAKKCCRELGKSLRKPTDKQRANREKLFNAIMR